jgi:phosphomannomutase
MKRRYFGTDGIRGQSNVFPMTPDLAMRVGIAVGTIFRNGNHRHRVVIGKDTRLSGYMLENAHGRGLYRRRPRRVPSRPHSDARRRHADAVACAPISA